MISVVAFLDEYAEAFARLNFEWIEHYFEVEEEDRIALGDPRGHIIDPGGEIFVALDDGEPVGAVAMIPRGAGFELAKMAVTPARRGAGIGRRLMDACLSFARERGATEIVLVTNDVLTPAMRLYESSGFVRSERYADARYARGNTEMRLTLSR